MELVLDGDGFRTRYIPPKAESISFVRAFVKGGNTEILRCDNKDLCINPTNAPYEVTIELSLSQKVRTRIDTLSRKYITSEAITDDEKAFLGDATSLPVYKYIQVMAAVGVGSLMTQEAAEYIAVSILLTQFQRIIQEIEEAVAILASIQPNDTHIKAFKKRLMDSKYVVNQMVTAANSDAMWKLQKGIKTYEDRVVIENAA